MGKIWLKSVDPNRQCCGCEGKTGPCSSCSTCVITGSFQSTVKDVYIGKSYGNSVYGAYTCAMPSRLSSFSPASGATPFPIQRNFSTSFLDSPFPPYDTAFDVFEAGKVALRSRAYALNGNANYLVTLDYTLSSSTTGLHFLSANSVYNLYDVTCQQYQDKDTQLAYIDQINFNARSGDVFTLSGRGYAYQHCSASLGINNTIGLFLREGCNPTQLNVGGVVTRKATTGAPNPTGWLVFNGNTYGGTSVAVSTSAYFNPGSFVTTPFVFSQANSWCGGNTHPRSGFSGPCIATSIGAGCVAYGSAAPCCTNWTVDQLVPTYTIAGGSLSFTVMGDQCITLQMGAFFETDISIRDRAGTAVDPFSRAASLYINTGLYTECSTLP